MWVRRTRRCEADLRIRLAHFFTQPNLFEPVQVNINEVSKLAVDESLSSVIVVIKFINIIKSKIYLNLIFDK
jgi:hypothetical protein